MRCDVRSPQETYCTCEDSHKSVIFPISQMNHTVHHNRSWTSTQVRLLILGLETRSSVLMCGFLPVDNDCIWIPSIRLLMHCWRGVRSGDGRREAARHARPGRCSGGGVRLGIVRPLVRTAVGLPREALGADRAAVRLHVVVGGLMLPGVRPPREPLVAPVKSECDTTSIG